MNIFSTAPRRRQYDPSKRRIRLPSGHIVSRNSPCPCGSGKRYKRCCHVDEPRIRAKVQGLQNWLQARGMSVRPGNTTALECRGCGTIKLREGSIQGTYRHERCSKCKREMAHRLIRYTFETPKAQS